MRAWKAVLPVAAVILVGGAAPAVDGDLARLQGRWVTKVGAKQEITIALEIKGETVSATISALGLKVLADGEVKIDDKVSPKRVDWVKLTTPDGHEFPEVLGIYEIEKDRLKIRSGGLHDDRPTAFAPGDGIWGQVAVFERP